MVRMRCSKPAAACISSLASQATAVFQQVKSNPATSGYYGNDPAEPYAAVFWYSAACTGISLLLVPFLTLKTQGNDTQTEDGDAQSIEQGAEDQSPTSTFQPAELEKVQSENDEARGRSLRRTGEHQHGQD